MIVENARPKDSIIWIPLWLRLFLNRKHGRNDPFFEKDL